MIVPVATGGHGRRDHAARPPTRPATLVAAALLLAACATDDRVPTRSTATPAESRALITQLIPATVTDRGGWAADIYAALSALQIGATHGNVCSVLAVIEQESSYRANPSVPELSKLAWREIDRQAEQIGIPVLLVHAALRLDSPDGRSYSERIDAAKTEQELSRIFEDFIDMVPMGRRLFADRNPVRTGGAMQVSIVFAEQHVQRRPYPYPIDGNIRNEVFSRRGGLYFGIAHLLDYRASYERPLYRFADFNAGHYTSRNAAFQNAVSIVSGQSLELDGDLIDPRRDETRGPGATEAATRSVASRFGMSAASVRAALEQEKSPQFEDTALFRRVFEAADQAGGKPAPRAVLPRIRLKSPKITRNLTTEWFAQRVDERFQRCMNRAKAEP